MKRGPAAPDDASSDGEYLPGGESRVVLLTYLRDNTARLLGIVQVYVQRMGLEDGEDVRTTALEALQDTVVEALEYADRFDANRQPTAWLLGIAVYVIRRRRAERARRRVRERPLFPRSAEAHELGDDIALLPAAPAEEPERFVETAEQSEALLGLVTPSDREILRLALIDEFDGEALATRLGVSAGTARMRLHRALARLRDAWSERVRRWARTSLGWRRL